MSLCCSFPWLEVVLSNPFVEFSLGWDIGNLSGLFNGLHELGDSLLDFLGIWALLQSHSDLSDFSSDLVLEVSHVLEAHVFLEPVPDLLELFVVHGFPAESGVGSADFAFHHVLVSFLDIIDFFEQVSQLLIVSPFNDSCLGHLLSELLFSDGFDESFSDFIDFLDELFEDSGSDGNLRVMVPLGLVFL